jgi:hypothetical protein
LFIPQSLQELDERSIVRYLQHMLPKSVVCPKCGKPGFLALRWVRSSHYCKIEIPNYVSQWAEKQVPNPIAGNGQEVTIARKRNFRRYAPIWHLYIGHYDSEKYKNAMEEYKSGRLKSRPNGRRWCKVRYNRARGEARSDRDILMAKYNFTLRDIMNEIDERREDIHLKHGIF